MADEHCSRICFEYRSESRDAFVVGCVAFELSIIGEMYRDRHAQFCRQFIDSLHLRAVRFGARFHLTESGRAALDRIPEQIERIRARRIHARGVFKAAWMFGYFLFDMRLGGDGSQKLCVRNSAT